MNEEPTTQRRPRPPIRTVRVRRIQRLSPRMLRVTVAGPELAGFPAAEQGPASHIKVFLPAPGQDQPLIPERGPEGLVFQEGPRPVIRTYTPRRYDAASQELDIDFVLHGHGPASAWASRARPGDVLAVAGPRGGFRPDGSSDWLLIAGDESALPAVATILEALPPSARAIVRVEVAELAEEMELAVPAGAELRWLHRDGREGLPGRLLESAIRETALPDGQGLAWVACEASVMRSIRRHLLYDRGLPRAALHTRGYWKEGEPNHPDHDTGEEV
jgi:NADPH-dependent ferric siderophore reductase